MELFASVFLLLWGHSAAQFPYFGKCPSPPVQENFDMNRFQGVWYEIKRTMSLLQLGSRCTFSNFSDAGYGDGSIEVVTEGKLPLVNLKQTSRLIATVPERNQTAKMLLRLSDVSIDSDFWILSTDYDNYAIIWSCRHIWVALNFARTENLWIKSRHRELSEDAQKKVDKILKSLKEVRVSKLLKKVDQKKCEDEEDKEDNTPDPNAEK